MERGMKVNGRGERPWNSSQRRSVKRPMNLSRGSMTVTSKPPPNANCICYRPKKLLLCMNCGYSITGRVRTFCDEHPKTIFLMDLDQCPGCLKTTMKEIGGDYKYQT